MKTQIRTIGRTLNIDELAQVSGGHNPPNYLIAQTAMIPPDPYLVAAPTAAIPPDPYRAGR